jgi:hypothetical protein
MSRICFGFGVLAVLVFAAGAHAAPLSVRVEDHDFSFDVPYWPTAPWGAVYSFNGAAPDSLTLQAPDPNHYAVSYSYTGAVPTVPGGPLASAFPYPVINSLTFGGDLKLDMTFAVNDGPYVDPNTLDRFDISLVGTSGRLTITGQILGQGFGGPPFPAQDSVLLDIVFDKVTLLARLNEDQIFKIEGVGDLKALLGETLPQLLPAERGVVAFDFIAKNPLGSIFTNPNYSPTDPITTTILGDISGHAGVPEPATVAMLAIGGLALVLRRRR